MTITEELVEAAWERGVRTVVTALRAPDAALTDGLHITHTGRLVEPTSVEASRTTG
ncbi:hypothetical protein [Kocuria flava]|uniref:Uncharacterized protein n=1 Tax=Kocuria flava TaxID=446860 RepID=A0ABQ0X7U0_9MICC|nr:hypothetical protein [Kocuria flava]GEO93697.1 hypothetical protein KFL01_30030 [Kocuria flava]